MRIIFKLLFTSDIKVSHAFATSCDTDFTIKSLRCFKYTFDIFFDRKVAVSLNSSLDIERLPEFLSVGAIFFHLSLFKALLESFDFFFFGYSLDSRVIR
jgi:hypothetical protein